MTTSNGTEWSITANSTSLTLTADDGALSVSSLRAGGSELLGAPSPLLAQADRALRYEHGNVESTDCDIVVTGTVPELSLEVTSKFALDPTFGTLTVAHTLRNDGNAPMTIDDISSLTLNVPVLAGWAVTTITGGPWSITSPPDSYRVDSAPLTLWPAEVRIGAGADGRSTTDALPWFALTNPDGGLIAALEWSGRWQMVGRRTPIGVQLRAGIADFRHELQPGESIDLPLAVVLGFEGPLEQGADIWRAWMLNSWCPAIPADWPWVQYNHWYAYYGDIDADRLFAEAEIAAELGCEVFVIDDGWFVDRQPDTYHRGWGNWTEDRKIFPDGIATFGDRIRGLGMKFGLWVEPERIDHEGVLAEEHPEFITLVDGEPIKREGRRLEGHHVCLGNPDAQDWMIREITRVVQEYKVDWLKWDYNIGFLTGCNRTDHGHQSGDGAWAHTVGLYHVLDELRANCPDLVIENCASGGHRTDLGTLRRTHTSWASDFTHRADSCRQHQMGAGLAMPLTYINTWVLNDRSVAEFRSRYGGAFGVSSHMGTWTDEQRAEFTAAVNEYKRLRPLLRGTRRELSGPNHSIWDVTQYADDTGDTIAILAVGGSDSMPGVRVLPDAIDVGATYNVTRDNAEPTTMAGGDLIERGVDITNVESDLIWLERVR